MLFSLLYLLSALSISSIAAYFSVLGLATIFPGAIIPIIIMGGVLEVGKIITAVWLHRNWKTAPFLIRMYLSFAVVTLMGITSMGIFGFLSKAHIEHQVTTEKAMALAEQVEGKIDREKEFVERQKNYITGLENRVATSTSGIRIDINQENDRIADITTQMNTEVTFEQARIDEANIKISTMKGEIAELEAKPGGLFSSKKKKIEELKARHSEPIANLTALIKQHNTNIDSFRTKAKEAIQSIEDKKEAFREKTDERGESVAPQIEEHNLKIAEAHNRIDELAKEKFSLSDNAKALEAEVGPVKYVAALIADLTGAEFDISQAVRIVIIILIFVFDPLAILLVIAANISISKHFPKHSKELNAVEEESKSLDILKEKLTLKKKSIQKEQQLLLDNESNLESKLVLAGEALKVLQDTIEDNENKIELQQSTLDEKQLEIDKASKGRAAELSKTLDSVKKKNAEIHSEEVEIKSKLDNIRKINLKLIEEEAEVSARQAVLSASSNEVAHEESIKNKRIEEQKEVVDQLNQEKKALKIEKESARTELAELDHNIKVQKNLISSLEETYAQAVNTESIQDLFSRHGVDETVKYMQGGEKILSIRDSRGRVHQFVIPSEYSSLKHDYFHKVVEVLSEVVDSDDLDHSYAQEITKYIRGPRPRYNCLT